MTDTARTCCLVFIALIMRAAEETKKNAVAVAVTCGLVFLLVYLWQDPCDGRKILANLCEEYKKGEVAGRLCYKFCYDQSIYLSYCHEDGPRKSFMWEKMMMRVPTSLLPDHHEMTLHEGMSLTEFEGLLLDFLRSHLGPHDFSDLMFRMKLFADFNDDEKLSLGEVQSLWRLIHIREFLVLFIFQGSAVFPEINGTCGSLFGFNFPQVSSIFTKEVSPILKLVSKNAFRWSFPSWEERARVAVGVLDLIFDIYEENHVRFVMCDLQPSIIGHTENYEAQVTDAGRILSSVMLESELSNRTCSHDNQCQYSESCTTMCDTKKQKCSGETIKPTIWQACQLIKDYLLFDAPDNIQPTLEKLLYNCMRLVIYGQSIDMSHTILVTDLKTVLWDHIKTL
ncbi:hypothetical protein C0Q70_18134 [Pomacea canaliculata]|uniref:FAM69 N-terminal domain-containing protein n=2 Tax=Pomacea canaliculata TaxID=400727 RepID=A0A2T7NMD3_POMCA|nr:hypothetical protein C0Q70_18134 [Pomacea canaliculata]